MAGSVLLIVVDRQEHRVAFNRCLKSSPHRLVFALDGEDAFDRFSEVKPDLIIAHVDTPRLDGAVLCQAIRAERGGDAVPFVLLGDLSSDDETAARCAEAGADGWVSIPFDRAGLLKSLAPLLTFGRPETEVLAPPARRVMRTSYPPGAQSEPDRVPAPRGESDLSPLVLSSLEDSHPDWATMDMKTDAQQVPTVSQGPVEPTDDIPTGRTEAPPFGIEADLLAEPEIPAGVVVGDDESEDDTNIISMEEFLQLSDAPEPTELDSIEPPLVKPVEDDDIDGIAADESFDFRPPLEGKGPTSETAKRAMIEEPMLPSQNDLGAVSRREPSVVSRQSDRMIEELPRERGTPSNAQESKPRQKGRQRKGLDESQLGKRLAERVRQLHEKLDGLDYYELLGVERTASDTDVKNAYFEMSLELHPDRFFLLRSGDLKEKIYAIFRRVSEAYDVLSNELRRAEYTAHLAASGEKRAPEEARSPPPEPRPREGSVVGAEVIGETDQGRRFVELARMAAENRDLNGARLYLTFALVYDKSSESIVRAIQEVAQARLA